MGKKRNITCDEIDNIDIYNFYRCRLINLALSQFEYHNLPDTMNRRYFEKAMLFNQTAAIYKVKGTDVLLSTGYVDKGTLDIYGEPTAIYGVGVGAGQIETDEFVLFYDNEARECLVRYIDLYAKLLYEVHQTLRSNLRQQVRPYIITTNKKQELTFRSLFKKIFSFEPVIGIDQTQRLKEDINVLDLKVDFKGIEMMDLLKTIWAEAISMLGISPRTTKKERVITDEIMMNRQEDILSLNARLLNRVEGINKVNEMFGTDITVNVATNLNTEFPFGDYAMQNLDNRGDKDVLE